MKKRYYTSFTQKLVLYLVSVLLLIAGLIFLFIFTSSRKFITENAFYQANSIATNVSRLLERKVADIENIPRTISGLFGNLDTIEITALPSKILAAYPFLSDCNLHYHTPITKQEAGYGIQAFQSGLQISQSRKNPDRFFYSDETHILRKNPHRGYWSMREPKGDHSLVRYCEPLQTDRKTDSKDILELVFSLKYLTDFIKDIKIFNSGYIFITDKEGNFLVHPDPHILRFRNLKDYGDSNGIDYSEVLDNFTENRTGYGSVYKKGVRYYLYYTPQPLLDWHVGIICPYRDIQTPSNRFCWLTFSILGIGFLFLYWSIVRIIKRSLTPLDEFTDNVRKITKGQLNMPLPEVSRNAELKELYEAFRFMQNSIITYIQQLKTTTAQNEKIITEMNLARKIQQSFLPKDILLPENIELYGKLKQSKSVGGDLYEYFILNDKLYFAIGDVSGKGVPASLYMASVIKLFRYVASRQHSPAAICNIINTHMCDNSEDDMYVTMFIGILDVLTGNITYTNAGHPQPLIILENGRIATLDEATDVPIGILENYPFKEYTYRLHKNEQILLFTDGITDAENIEAQFFGKAKLIECIEHTRFKDPRTIVTAILNGIHNHIQDSDQSDDFTILDILYKGKSGSQG